MIVEFNEHQYIVVEDISALRWIPPNENDNQFPEGLGIVVVGGIKLMVNRNDFDTLEKAFRWKHSYALRDQNLQKIKMGDD